MKKIFLLGIVILFPYSLLAEEIFCSECSKESISAALYAIDKCGGNHTCAIGLAKGNPIRGCGEFIKGCYKICEMSGHSTPVECIEACSGNLE